MDKEERLMKMVRELVANGLQMNLREEGGELILRMGSISQTTKPIWWSLERFYTFIRGMESLLW